MGNKTPESIRFAGLPGDVLDYIEKIQAENATLRKRIMKLGNVLTPFACLLKPHHKNMVDNHPIFAIEDAIITKGDIRKAYKLVKTFINTEGSDAK